MSLKAKLKETEFGVGDTVKVTQEVKERDKTRSQVFEGIVIGIKGCDANKSFTVRRIGAAQIGIERIFPLSSPTIEKVEVMRQGTRGVRRAKLFYIREKPKREIEKIYSRAKKREKAKQSKIKPQKKQKDKARK